LRTSSKILLGSSALIMVLMGLLVGETFATRYQAAGFLNDVRALRVGRSSFGDLVRLRQKYKRFSSVDSLACNPNLCTMYFSFDNRWLYRLRVLPASRFGAYDRYFCADGALLATATALNTAVYTTYVAVEGARNAVIG